MKRYIGKTIKGIAVSYEGLMLFFEDDTRLLVSLDRISQFVFQKQRPRFIEAHWLDTYGELPPDEDPNPEEK